MISSDSIQLSSSDDEGPCDFEDHPYSSPGEDSDNDNKIVEMDFSVFSMEHTQLTDEDPEDPVTSNQDEASNVAETVELVDHTDCVPADNVDKAVLFKKQFAVKTGRRFGISLLRATVLQSNRFSKPNSSTKVDCNTTVQCTQPLFPTLQNGKTIPTGS